jgi:CRISPR type III-associated protein (TIGR04423 family)
MPNTITKITDQYTIPNLSYEGYLWYSDASIPFLINTTQPFNPAMLTSLPFVIEGMLYNGKEQISIRIVNADGNYMISKMELPEMKATWKKEYLAKKHFGEGTRICIYEHWEDKIDPIQDNRPVLLPGWSAFIGFKKK